LNLGCIVGQLLAGSCFWHEVILWYFLNFTQNWKHAVLAFLSHNSTRIVSSQLHMTSRLLICSRAISCSVSPDPSNVSLHSKYFKVVQGHMLLVQ